MRLRAWLTMLSAAAPALAVVVYVLGHDYAAAAVLAVGLVASVAAVAARPRTRSDRIAAWTAFAANALVVALVVAAAILLSNDSS